MIKVEVYTSEGMRYVIHAETLGDEKASAEFKVEQDTPEGGSCIWRMFTRNLKHKSARYLYRNGYHRRLASC
jgi:hypothetical protein